MASVPEGPAVEGEALEKRMKLRYAGACRLCGVDLPARADAIYERASKSVRCVDCPTPDAGVEQPQVAPERLPGVASDAGLAGSSARRVYERRKAKDEERLRQKWGRLGGIAVALSDEKQSTKAWATGAVGEERLGARLDSLAGDDLAVLHDRRITGSKTNIDHVVITRAGIWVIDAKRYKGRPELRIEGGIFRPRVEKLVVGRRDCTKLVDRVHGQVGMVRDPGMQPVLRGSWPAVAVDLRVSAVQRLIAERY
jgi:hypothetical protein